MQDTRYPDGYNGWTNKETWAVSLWLTNDKATHEAAVTVAKDGPEALREFVEEMVLGEDPPANLATDLLETALAWVDWEELHSVLSEA